ncbi:hypothetical protein GGR50DRAFT_182798 [Xylaria sp. CBS 124048]|nr:hypothetical protein GGR50DRAFT_182798 [Xylaria sp. CBS 124048]
MSGSQEPGPIEAGYSRCHISSAWPFVKRVLRLQFHLIRWVRTFLHNTLPYEMYSPRVNSVNNNAFGSLHLDEGTYDLSPIEPPSLSDSDAKHVNRGFSEKLAADLPETISQGELSDLSAVLPSLIESFGRRVSEENTIRTYSNFADSIYRSRIEITESVVTLVAVRHAANDFSGRQLLSIKTPNQNPTSHVLDHLFEMPAYAWLVASVMKELHVEVPYDSSGRSARSSLLECFRGLTLKSMGGLSPVSCITYMLPADALWEKPQRSESVSLQPDLLQRVVLIGKDNNAYATTCGEYAKLIWLESGLEILLFLAEIGRGLSTRNCKLSNGTSISGQIYTGDWIIRIEATGSYDSLIEIGELLAWANTALRSPKYTAIARSQPTFTATTSLDTGHLGPVEISSHTLRPRKMSNSVEVTGECWKDLFGELPLVTGYPIPKRSQPNTGVEISLPIMAALTNSEKVTIFSEKILIKGFSTALIPTQYGSNFVYWHMVSNEDGDYLEYQDPRIRKVFEQYPIGLTMRDLEQARHIVGWCANVKNNTGASNANYSIEWSGLDLPQAGLAFDKISISGGMFVTGAASVVLGKKHKAVKLRSRDDYIMRLKWISKKFVLLYDVRDRRGWLVDGLSAILHLVRASLRHDLEDPFKSVFIYNPQALKEASFQCLGKDSAIKILTDPENLALPLYAKPTNTKEETVVNETGASTSVLSKTKSYYCFKDRVESICEVLEKIIAHHADVASQDGVGFRLKTTPRRHLEGFDFMDIATDEDPLWPRVMEIRSAGKGWVDFTRAIHAVTLFGRGFGELIEPREAHTTAYAACSMYDKVPKGKDYLAVCVRDIQDILEKRGSQSTIPWKLTDDIYWHTPDKTFEACTHRARPNSKCERVQVLLPATFPKLWGRGFKSPVSLAPEGALLFGHNSRFPLRWRDHGDPEEEKPDQELAELEEIFEDSGIGSSLAPSITSASDMDQTSSFVAPDTSPGTKRAQSIPSEDKPASKKRRPLGKTASEKGQGLRLNTFLSPVIPFSKKGKGR